MLSYLHIITVALPVLAPIFIALSHAAPVPAPAPSPQYGNTNSGNGADNTGDADFFDPGASSPTTSTPDSDISQNQILNPFWESELLPSPHFTRSSRSSSSVLWVKGWRDPILRKSANLGGGRDSTSGGGEEEDGDGDDPDEIDITSLGLSVELSLFDADKGLLLGSTSTNFGAATPGPGANYPCPSQSLVAHHSGTSNSPSLYISTTPSPPPPPSTTGSSVTPTDVPTVPASAPFAPANPTRDADPTVPTPTASHVGVAGCTMKREPQFTGDGVSGMTDCGNRGHDSGNGSGGVEKGSFNAK